MTRTNGADSSQALVAVPMRPARKHKHWTAGKQDVAREFLDIKKCDDGRTGIRTGWGLFDLSSGR